MQFKYDVITIGYSYKPGDYFSLYCDFNIYIVAVEFKKRLQIQNSSSYKFFVTFSANIPQILYLERESEFVSLETHVSPLSKCV